MLPELSLDTANSLHTAFNLLLILAAFGVFIGTIGVVWTGSIRERYADERQKPRRLTLAQRSSLVDAWSMTDKGEISIDFMAADGESEAFARDLAEALRMSGWIVARVGPLVPFGTSTPIGLRLIVRDRETPEVRGLISGFDYIGIKGEVHINPKTNPPIQLWVGNKP